MIIESNNTPKNDVVIVDHQPIILTGILQKANTSNGGRFEYLEGLDEYLESLANIRKREKRNNTIDNLLND